MNPVSILLAEDDESDVILLQRAFREVALSHPVHVVGDGMQAIEFLSRVQADERLPGLVILDLKMPRRGGMQVLQWMRAQPIIRCIPVLVFSSSANQNDVEGAYDSGANGFLIKPPSIVERTAVAQFIKTWLGLVQFPLAAVESIRAAQAQRAPLHLANPGATSAMRSAASPP